MFIPKWMPDRVEVVYIINTLEVGGAELGMCRLLESLDQDRYAVTVVPLRGESTALVPQIPSWVDVVLPRSNLLWDLQALRAFIDAARNADVIVGSLFYSATVAKIIGLLNRSATVATWRHSGVFTSRYRKTVFNWTQSLGDVVLADSNAVADVIRAENRVDPSTVHTVPIAGIDLNNYTSVTHDATDTAVVGTLGRLTDAKNPTAVLNVAARLEESNIEFKIAGDGDLYDELDAKIERRCLENVTLCGFIGVEGVPDFLSSLDVYFQPSRHEGLCITVLEAMASGLPIVGSDVGGIGRNVEHKTNGFLYEPHDIDGFSSGIERLANDPDLRAKFGEQGRTTVDECFTRETLRSEFEHALRVNSAQ